MVHSFPAFFFKVKGWEDHSSAVIDLNPSQGFDMRVEKEDKVGMEVLKVEIEFC
jgi:hypothetical protein